MNLAAYRALFPAAGFSDVEAGRPFRVASNRGYEPKPRSRRPLYGVLQKAAARRGIPHAWVMARP